MYAIFDDDNEEQEEETLKLHRLCEDEVRK